MWPVTSTGDVLQAYFERRTRHAPGALFDHLAYVGVRSGRAGWKEDDASPFSYSHTVEHARAWYERSCLQDEYIDCHAWQFTPSSLRLVFDDLHRAGFMDLREAAHHDPLGQGDPEFYLVLSRSGAGCPLSRLALTEGVRRELTTIPPLLPT